MSIIRDIFIGTVIGGLTFVIFKKKVDNWKSTISKLQAVPTGFNNLRAENGIAKFNIDVTLYNPTNEDFKPDGVIAVLQKINVKDNFGNNIGKINVNKSYIVIPAKTSIVLKNMLVEVPIMQNILNWKNLLAIKSLKDIKLESVITVLGKEYLIVN